MLKLSMLDSNAQYPTFCCREPGICEYFNTKLKSDVARFVNAAYILWEDDEIVGFFTLSQHSIKREKQRGKGHFKDIAATLLGQFAISDKYCGKKTPEGAKYSEILLAHALNIHVRVAKMIGSTTFMLNPINDEVKEKFYNKFGLFKDYASSKNEGYMFAKTADILLYLNDTAV